MSRQHRASYSGARTKRLSVSRNTFWQFLCRGVCERTASIVPCKAVCSQTPNLAPYLFQTQFLKLSVNSRCACHGCTTPHQRFDLSEVYIKTPRFTAFPPSLHLHMAHLQERMTSQQPSRTRFPDQVVFYWPEDTPYFLPIKYKGPKRFWKGFFFTCPKETGMLYPLIVRNCVECTLFRSRRRQGQCLCVGSNIS